MKGVLKNKEMNVRCEECDKIYQLPRFRSESKNIEVINSSQCPYCGHLLNEAYVNRRKRLNKNNPKRCAICGVIVKRSYFTTPILCQDCYMRYWRWKKNLL